MSAGARSVRRAPGSFFLRRGQPYAAGRGEVKYLRHRAGPITLPRSATSAALPRAAAPAYDARMQTELLRLPLLLTLIATTAASAACTAPPSVGEAALIDPAQPWTRHTISSAFQGADGHALGDVDGDGDLDVAVAWEQSAKITISLQPSLPSPRPWPTTVVMAMPGAEDVELGDLDHDGILDMVGAGQGKKIMVAFGRGDGTFDPALTLPVATGLQYWMQLELVDTDGDGDVEIVAGGRVAYPARIVALHAGGNPRHAPAWTLEEIGYTGWTMGLVARDVDGDGDADLVVSDRQWYNFVAGGPRSYDLMGTRWLERTAAGWVNHAISAPPAGKTARFFADGGSFLLDGYTADGGTASVVTARAGWGGWSGTNVPWPDSMGGYQAAALADIDGDGLTDIVASAADAVGELEGVTWLRAPAWTPHEVSGAPGEKFDAVEVVDLDRDGVLDIVTTEQNDGLGIVYYTRP